MGKASREKGKRGEYEVRDILKSITGIEWMRTPLSGGFHLSFPWDVMPKIQNVEHIMEGVGVEVKNTETLAMPKWIEQCEEAEEDFGTVKHYKWVIFFKHKGRWYITIPVEQFKRFLGL